MDTPSSSRAGPAAEILAPVLILGYGVLLVRLVPAAAYAPVNLAAAGVAIALARRLGVDWRDLGLARDRMLGGLRLGALWLLPVAAGVAIAVALPATRGWFLDETILEAGAGQVLYALLVKIPFGTALAEELIFRGALLGLFLQRHRPWVAVALSSVVFGLWHVVSTAGRLDTNQAADTASGWEQAGIVAGAVVVTAVAGLFFGWLRLRSGSVLAPWLTHTGVNMLAFGGARAAGRLQG
jgi:membrane protease YdiL (CAAX protease family)